MTTTISVVKAWAIATKVELGYVDDNNMTNSCNFDSALLFPGQNLPCFPSGMSRDKENIEVHKILTKMFYFSETKISSIRERAKVDNSSSQGVGLSDFVDCLSNSVQTAVDYSSVVLSLEKEGQTLLSQELGELLKSLASPELCFVGLFTSWCKFPLYEADFGWGNPIWVSGANIPMNNTVILIDEKSGGGIEAWMSLKESDMKEFIKHNEVKDVMDCN
ncbi:pelargonidin 3-O-(6-caffeoylglucoside) 5-O-(6-O-malonylglucoside) 4'''-malonyltransferase-like [Apium graveolens]|uniref:pelargonidin 3-O-(6-caffeoylglucoside) 5-O-(6-O-malonylglucoside) 4'''-malonyltransferase-like n=1 Tax=Apium graveolens TaxID=4045 RepID=UPI003D78CCA9